jgi:hypothetical protein
METDETPANSPHESELQDMREEMIGRYRDLCAERQRSTAAIRERDELRTALLVTRRHVDIVSDRITRVLSSPTAPATDQAPETGEVKG